MPNKLRTKIIAEIGYNHNGSIELAKEMIEAAADLNLWAVKFQKWAVDDFPKWLKRQERSIENSFGLTYYDHRKFLEFSIDQHAQLKEYAESLGLQYICSGKDFTSVKELVDELKIKYIKLPSQRLIDQSIFDYLKPKKIIKMISTGMSYEKEIVESRWLKEADVIMHCVSLYPARIEDCDFGFLRNNSFFNGYSSHEEDGSAIKYAVMLGCEYIERHFTTDKTLKGSDHKISSDPDEMRRIITEIREAEIIFGDGKRNISGNEQKIRDFYREF